MIRSEQKANLIRRKARRVRIRSKIGGTLEKPRLSVFRSLKYISAQLIDDKSKNTLLGLHEKTLKPSVLKSAKSKPEYENFKKNNIAYILGLTLGKQALEKGIKTAVFDKQHYKYHGRIKAVADGLRDAGIKL